MEQLNDALSSIRRIGFGVMVAIFLAAFFLLPWLAN
jgi:hypothetical protein